MAEWLQWGLRRVALHVCVRHRSRAAADPVLGARFWLDVAIVAAVTLLSLVLVAAFAENVVRRDLAAFSAVTNSSTDPPPRATD